MTPEMQKYIDLLESQLGYSEKGGAYTKFGDWYGKTVEFDADYSAAPWCDMYLSWAAHKLGYEDWIGQFAWTVRHAEWFKAQGAWGKTPKPGAFVFYDWSGSGSIDDIDHVGIVTKVQGDTIFTIEGNIDGGVAKRKERDTSKVVGYGYPERIKARLDAEAAQKRADEQAALPARPDVGTLHLPGNSLSSLIPHVDQNDHPAPLAHPKTPGDSPTTTGDTSASPGNSSATTGGSSTTTGGSSTSTGGSSASTGGSSATTDGSSASADGSSTSADGSSAGTGGSSAGTGGSSASATGDASRTSAEAAAQGGAPVVSAGPTSAAGKSSATKPKHAKATTADTTSTTAEPLPTHVDASASSSLPTIASPTLVGSALVAALALLALTKTRLRPSLAAARSARRAPGTGSRTPGSRTPGADSPTRPATSAAEPHSTGTPVSDNGSRRTSATGTGTGSRRTGAAGMESGSPRTGAAGTGSGSRRTGAAETGSGPHRSGGSRSGRGSHAAPGRRRRRRLSDQRGVSSRSPQFLDRDEPAFPPSYEPAATVFDAPPTDVREHATLNPLHATATGTHESVVTGTPQPVTIPSGDGTFERVTVRSGDGTFEPVAIPSGGSVFETFTGREPSRRPFDAAAYDAAAYDVAPPTAPYRPVFDTGPLEPISLSTSTSTFNAFAPATPSATGTPGEARTGVSVDGRSQIRTAVRTADASDISATYRGRRRRSEEPAEGSATDQDLFTPKLPPRGRRHRRTGGALENPWSLHPSDGRTAVDTFLQDLPLKGRRHRSPAQADDQQLV